MKKGKHSLNILGQKYSLRIVREKKMPAKNALGLCNSNRNIIHLSKSLSGDKRNEVLLHEIIHAISEMIELNLTEVQVNNLAVGLLPYIDIDKLNCSVKKEI